MPILFSMPNAYIHGPTGRAFQDEEVREKVIPAYMGLIKQCDDKLGRLLDHLEATGRLSDTMIVLTSDHGDYLGDHWMGEKNLFHDASVNVPMILYDPRTSADETRGTVCDALAESIDLAATFIDTFGRSVPDHIVEGRSLMPWVNAEAPEWRDFAISEYDFSMHPLAVKLGLEPRDCRLFMVFDGRFKLMHCAAPSLRPMLFDLETDPDELSDLAKGSTHQAEIDRLTRYLHEWGLRMSQRLIKSEADIKGMRGSSLRRGILTFLKDGSEVDARRTAKYRGPVHQNHLKRGDGRETVNS